MRLSTQNRGAHVSRPFEHGLASLRVSRPGLATEAAFAAAKAERAAPGSVADVKSVSTLAGRCCAALQRSCWTTATTRSNRGIGTPRGGGPQSAGQKNAGKAVA